MTVIFFLNLLAKLVEDRGFTVETFDVENVALVVAHPDSDYLGTVRVTVDFDFEDHDVVFQVGGGARVPGVAYGPHQAVVVVADRFRALAREWE